ncbi:MAG TPA: RNA polymerase sigma factor [Bacteroidales bacterium]|nr:RNA polymerase sigma factor [Bacteroidales bacterium]
MIYLEDTQVINRILAGNTREYEVLVNRYKDLAFTIAFRILNNREDAEEAAQDSFIKAFRGLSSFRKDSGFSTWLYRIVYNTAVSKKRLKKQIFQNIDELPLSDLTDAPKYDFDAMAERGMILEKAMQRLPEEDRVLITLFYVNESSVEEIQQITGMSKSNIKVRLFRSRKKLQELVSKMTEKIYF